MMGIRAGVVVAVGILGGALHTGGLQASAQAAAGSAGLARIRVEAGEFPRHRTPVSVQLTEPLSEPGPLEVVDSRDGSSCPAQLGADGRTVSWVLNRLGAGEWCVFELRVSTDVGDLRRAVELGDNGEALQVRCAGDPVLSYRYAVLPPPEGVPALFERSGFIHPLFAPDGTVLTQIHPADHYHHLGLWNPWTHTEVGGRPVDFWNLGSGQGTVRFVEFVHRTPGRVYGEFVARQHHIDLQAPGGEAVALDENWRVRVWNLGGYDDGFFVCDLESVYVCGSEPVVLKEYRYGGLGFRATAAWDGKGDYLTSEGRTGADGHGTRSRWCDVYGPTPYGTAGVLFMSHSANRSHPEPMRIWSGDPKIFFNYCPPQVGDWALEPGGTYTLRYRMFVHNGRCRPAMADRLWRDFADPPRVTVVR